MGSQSSYQRLSMSMEDAKEKAHQLSQKISHFYATRWKKHYWCAVIFLTLFVITVLILARQVPEVCPEVDRRLRDENSELRKEISALKANITSLKMEMESIRKEKAKLGEEHQALRGQLVDTTQHLEEARMDMEDLRGRLDAMNQTLSKTQKQLEESTIQGQMQVDLRLANKKLKETLRQRDSCHTQLEEKIASYNAESKYQQAENEKLKGEIESVQQNLQNIRNDRAKCQEDVFWCQTQQKSACNCEHFQDDSWSWVAPGGAVVILLIFVYVSCCK